MFDNNRGQGGPVAMIFLVLAFIAMWAIFLGKWLSDIGEQIITTNGYTGIEAFAYANINLWVFLCLILGILGFMYFGATR